MTVQTLLSGWNPMRWLRLGLGLVIAMQSIESHDVLLGILALLFLFQAVTNTGCCEANGCKVPDKMGQKINTDEVEYETIESKK